MENIITIEARCFPVLSKNLHTDQAVADVIVLSKQQLQAAQYVGQSSKELIFRIYRRKGFEVVSIGKPQKKTISVDLLDLWEV